MMYRTHDIHAHCHTDYMTSTSVFGSKCAFYFGQRGRNVGQENTRATSVYINYGINLATYNSAGVTIIQCMSKTEGRNA